MGIIFKHINIPIQKMETSLTQEQKMQADLFQ